MSNKIKVLEMNDSNSLVLAVQKFPFLSELYTDNGDFSNGPAIFPNDPGFLTTEQEQKVIDAGFGQWVDVYHYNNDEISQMTGIEIDDLSDPGGYSIDRIETWLEEKSKRFAHFTSTGDWYVAA